MTPTPLIDIYDPWFLRGVAIALGALVVVAFVVCLCCFYRVRRRRFVI
jgi:hypothetical protein